MEKIVIKSYKVRGKRPLIFYEDKFWRRQIGLTEPEFCGKVT